MNKRIKKKRRMIADKQNRALYLDIIRHGMFGTVSGDLIVIPHLSPIFSDADMKPHVNTNDKY